MLQNLKIGTRLAILLGSTVLLMIISSGLAMQQSAATEDRMENIVHLHVHKANLLQDMSESVHIVSRVMRTLITLSDDAAITREVIKIDAAQKKYLEAEAALDEMPGSAEGMAMRAKTKEARDQAQSLNHQVIDLAKGHQDFEATELLLNSAAPAAQRWQDILDENISLQRENTQTDYTHAVAAYYRARNIIFGVCGFSVVLAVICGIWVTRSITAPLRSALTLAHSIARGDLTGTLQTTAKDEIADLQRAMAQMRDNLSSSVGMIRRGSQQVAEAAGELATNAARVTTATHTQSEAVSGTAAAVEEVTVSISSVAQNAEDVRVLATSSVAQTAQVNANMEELVGEISKVETAVDAIAKTVHAFIKSANNITEMTKQVTDIAEQTNLLALNAAIEAARAGEQGRGFAVVADEVRRLAEKSAQSASEIDAVTQTLGEQSTQVEKAIGQGVESLKSSRTYVDVVVKVLDQAKDSVTRATHGIEDIAASVKEQTLTSTDIARNVEKIAQMAEENHSAVDRTSTAVRALEVLSADLLSVVGKFKLAS
jgi:methyl-accepting chemotaxis protein